MARDLNRWQGIGRLGNDPETRYMPNGDPVCNFRIACGDDYKSKSGEKVEATEWIGITAFRQQADICGKYLQKGSRVYVDGKLKTREWTDKDNNKRYTTYVELQNMQMLDSKNQSNKNSNSNSDGDEAQSHPAPDFDKFEDDIPF